MEVAEDLAARSASAEAAGRVRRALDALTTFRGRDEQPTSSSAADGAGDVSGDADDAVGDGLDAEGNDGRPRPADATGSATMSVARLEDRQRDVEDEANVLEQTMRPRTSVPGLRLPVVRTLQITSNYQLADITAGLVPVLRDLGRTLAADPDNVLRRTEIMAARVETGDDGIPRTVVTTRSADDLVLSGVTDSIEPAEIVPRLQRAILHSRVATGRRQDRQPARLLAEAVVDGAGEQASVLGRYLDQVTGSVLREVTRAVEQSSGHVEQVDSIELAAIDWPRPRHDVVLSDHHGEFNRRIAYSGWRRGLYEEVRFDSSPERTTAVILDSSPDSIEVWVRLRRNDLAVNWTGTGRQYNPDFLVAEPIAEYHGRPVRRCWVIEVKADNRMDDDEVQAKFTAARQWASRVNAEGIAEPDEWHVMLASETQLAAAHGSWTQLVKLAATDL